MKELLELFNKGFKWIARNKYNNTLWVYEEKPIKFGVLFGKQPNDKPCEQIDDNLLSFITFENSPFKIHKIAYDMLEFDNNTSLSKIVNVYGGRGSNKHSLANVRKNIIKIREEKEMNLIKNNKAYNLNTDLPRVIAYNEVTQLTTLVYNTDKVIRTKPSLKDKNKGDKELGLLIGLLKGLECNDFDAQLGYAYKKYNNKPVQLKVHFRALLGERLPILSHTQLDKLIENVVNGKDVKLVIQGNEKNIKVNIKEDKNK